ncbi:MAG: hypothetical protein ACJAT4_003239, partial [Granulosicoccus sp.]
MKNLLLTVFAVTFLFLSFPQAQVDSLAVKIKKEVAAQRTQNDVKINGELDEFDWSSAEIATDLTQLNPAPGEKASNQTEIKVMYDDQAIYISAKMYTDPANISKQLTERDALDNCDWFGILLSPYQDGINALEFIITSAGVQFDAKLSTFGEDEAWDAVWRGETKITDYGWIAEVAIPYSAIRFPDKKEQDWDVNF